MSKSKPKAHLRDYICHQVLSVAWPPGHSLDEAALSEQFGVSRTPLREVCRDLAGQGYLLVQPNRNTRVADLSHETLREFFQTAPMVYSAVLNLAAQNRTDAQLARLIAIQADFVAALGAGDGVARALANHAFHKQTAVMANNRYLQPSFERLLIDHTRIAHHFYQADAGDMDTDTACNQHQWMIDAIAARDGARAGQLALDHWALSRDRFAQFVMPPALDAQGET